MALHSPSWWVRSRVDHERYRVPRQEFPETGQDLARYSVSYGPHGVLVHRVPSDVRPRPERTKWIQSYVMHYNVRSWHRLDDVR